jgi:catechol 2,3-dioxygenase-like lactoylglutathione lyase family enzyme
MRYAHTNIVARDWRALADFYVAALDCEILLPERDHRGDWVGELTGIAGAAVKGAHLRLPGYGEGGPTLEIFEYNCPADCPPPALNRFGLAHLAFEVADVEAARQRFTEAGGTDVGSTVTRPVAGAGTITLIYMRDLEGNIVELQRWSE